MDHGTVWYLSFSNDGHNRSLVDTLGNLYAQVATGLIGVPVAEEFPQCLAVQMCRGMQLLC